MRFRRYEEIEARINLEISRCNYSHCEKLCEFYLKRAGEFEKRNHLPQKVDVIQMARNEIYNRLLTFGEDFDVLKDII